MATLAQDVSRDESFFQKMAIGLAVFIVFGFLQFAARGFVNYTQVPLAIHVHAVAMVGWLTVLVTQATLVQRNNLAVHRKLGWIAAALVIAIVAFGSNAAITAIRMHISPPFFTPPYFLALTHVGLLAFAFTVAYAISRRRETDWHRRLMLGATVLLMEPALGRLLPMPLLGGWGEWIALVFQLGAVGIIARHDGRTLGRIHPATIASALIVTLTHVLVSLTAMTPPVIAAAARLTA
ncbi:MAG: hypothetical protein JF593_05570 [Novosphingobium sp.]|nr:hypothetical protein [Novosphingobium sp.]